MTDAALLAAVGELNDIVSADGARLTLRSATSIEAVLELDLSRSSCPECVLPKALLIQIIGNRIAATAPDIETIELVDPREP